MSEPREYTGLVIEDDFASSPPTEPVITGTEQQDAPVDDPVARLGYVGYGDKTYEYEIPNDATDEQIAEAATNRLQQEFPDAAFVSEKPNRMPSYSMYDNMTQDQAQNLYKQWESAEGVRKSIAGLVWKNPADKNEYIVPEPDTSMGFLEGVPGLGFLAEPSPSFFDKVDGGLYNSARNVGELGASLIDLGTMGATSVFGDTYNPDLTGKLTRNIPAMPNDSLVATGTEIVSGLGLGSGVKKVGKEILDPFLKSATKEAAEVAAKELAEEGVKEVSKGVLATVAKGGKEFVADTAKLAVKALPAELGVAATLSSDSDTLFVGAKAMLPLSRGLTADMKASEAEKVIKARGNILVDAIMLAPVANLAINGVTAAGRLSWGIMVAPFLKVGSQSTAEKAIVEQILDKLATVRSGTGEVTNQAKQDIIRLIEDNKEVLLSTPDNVIADMKASTVVMDQVRALTAKGDTDGAQKLIDDYQANQGTILDSQTPPEFGPPEPTSIPLDTMSALEQGLAKEGDTAVNRQMTTQARGMRSGVINSGGGAPETIERLSTPARMFEEVTTGVEQARGGSGAIEGARQAVVDDATGVVKQTEDALGTANARLADAERNVVKLIKEDPTFGADVDRLSRASGIDIYAGRNQAETGIVDNVRKAYEKMTTTKNGLYEAVQGGDVDALGLIKAMDQLQPGQLDIAISALPGNSQVGAFLRVTRRQMVDAADGTVRRETDGEAFERVSQWLYANKVDYGQLYREIRPTVSQTAELMFAASDPAAKAGGRALRNFVGWIDGPGLDHVIEIGDTAVADAARRAKEYYVNDYAPFWRDGRLKDVAELYNRTVGRTSEGMAAAGQEVMPVTFRAEARNTLTSTLNDANREYAGQLIDLLSRSEAGGNTKLVTDYILGDAVGGITSKLEANPALTLGSVDVADVVGKLNQYRTILTENFPQEAGRISAFIDNLGASKGNVERMRGVVSQAEEAAKAAKDSLRDGAVSRFFKDKGVPNPNGYAVLEGIFKSPQGADQLDELVLAGQSNPLIRDGVQAAYARYVRERFLGTVQEIGGNRAVKPGQISALQNELTPVLEHGEKIFKDAPEVLGSIEGLLDLAGFVTRSKNARAIASDPATASRMEASRATNRIVTAVFGVLSRRGAVIRNFSNALIRKATPEDMVYRMMDQLYANPDKFVAIARGLVKDETAVAARKSLAAIAARTIINSPGNPNFEESGLEAIVNEAVNAAAKYETSEPVDQQTEDAFQQAAEDQVEGEFGGTTDDPDPVPEAFSDPTPFTGDFIPE